MRLPCTQFRIGLSRCWHEARHTVGLYISETTVKTHVTHILQKLNLRDRVQAVVLAYQTGSSSFILRSK